MKALSRILSTSFASCLILLSSCITDHVVQQVYVQKGLKLSPTQENPATSSQGWGTADVSYDKGTKILSYTLHWSNLTGNATGAHIHGTSPRGTNSAVMHNFFNLINNAPSGTFSYQVEVDGTKINETDLLNGLYYFNFHTPNNPGGEIRGQIEFYDQSNVVSKMGLVMSPDQEVPAKVSPATGSVDVIYNKTTKLLSFTLSWKDLTGIPQGAHIHGTALPGVNAGIKYDFFSAAFPKTTSGSFSSSVVVDGVAINEPDLLAGKYYFNMHTPANPGGEIRGQLVF